MKFEQIRILRENKNLKQREIAKALNVERSTYAGWETGRDPIPLRKLNDLCEFHKVTFDYITGISNFNNYKDNKKKNINIEVLSNNLKKLREIENLMQKDLCMLLNVSSSSYSEYENGKILIPTLFLYKIAKTYNYSIDWILGKKKINKKQ